MVTILKSVCFLFITILCFSTINQAQAKRQVLKFDRQFFQHVNHGEFWDVYTPQNPLTLSNEFAWEAWVKIDEDLQQGYWISSGYGGAHAILAGFTKDQNGKYAATGNVISILAPCSAGNENSRINSFSSEGVFSPGIWYHVAVANKNNVITIYKNGVPLNQVSFLGQRVSSTCSYFDASAGTLFIGGSDHLNFSGSIAMVRGWEGYSPYNGSPFIPEISFRSDLIDTTGAKKYAAFIADYTTPASIVKDLSNGYNGKTHSGSLHSAIYRLYGSGKLTVRSGKNLPKWENNEDFPLWADSYQAETADSIPTPPAGAVIFDSFNRTEVNLASDTISLGTTELGNKTWRANPELGFGIQNNKAIYLAPNYYATNLIETGLQNSRVCVDVTSGKNSGIAIRATSPTNFIGLAYSEGTLVLTKITAAGNTTLGSVAQSNVTKLCLEASGSSITGGTNNTPKVFNVREPTMNGTKAGLYVFIPTPVTTFENFAVYPLNGIILP